MCFVEEGDCVLFGLRIILMSRVVFTEVMLKTQIHREMLLYCSFSNWISFQKLVGLFEMIMALTLTLTLTITHHT